jgi:general stress protein YciG
LPFFTKSYPQKQFKFTDFADRFFSAAEYNTKVSNERIIMMAWYGDSKGHAEAGRKGGKAQGKKNNPGNFANDREKAKRAGQKGGSSSNDRD